ncbi:nose resistant to fluoxetine protein 6-like [Temnothorax americanus]|uniref:nose resistant to fluoxetine protein 6-like n=1 Tax=Temnothorax americanus TaxID=1964332 RepID=UPI004068D2E7
MLQRQLAFIFCIYTNLAALLCVSAHSEFNDARIQTLPAYEIASKADLLELTTCRKELQNFRDAVNQRILWSLKVLDSSGCFESGFLYGNSYWLGSHSQCLDTMNTIPLQISQRKILNNTLYRDPRKEFPPFQINYFVAHFRHNNTIQYHVNMFNEDVITIGLCLPASCTTNNISFILEKIFHNRVVVIGDLYSAGIQLIQVKDLNDDNKRLPNDVLHFICIGFGFSFLMTTIGTIYDIFVYQKRVKKNEANKTRVENMSEEIGIKANLSSHWKSQVKEILICFSAYTNTRKIFDTKLDADTIPVIHGLKFLSMCLIIIFHSAYYALDFFDNKVWSWRFIESYGTYIFGIGLIAVDIFFFSSGCLVTYTYLRDKTDKVLMKPINEEKLVEFLIYVIKRFIRLTPTYMMVLGISQLSSAWFDKTSQFYVYEKSHETCAKYWWRNLLYINNLFSLDAMCMSWSWYLANDMQFYIIAMALLILLTIYFYAAVTILSALLIGSIILSGYVSYIYEYVPTFDEQQRLLDVLYIPPWMRISPYIIGIIAGYILTKLKNNLFFKKKIIIFCWCLAIICKVFVITVLYNRYISILATSIYVALHRILWTIGTAWIVIACSTKHGGIINQLLSFKGWMPLSRLTYCVYLLNPVIIRSTRLYSETSIHFEFLPFIVMILGYIMIIYVCSYALCLMIEMPSILLMKMFIKYCNSMHKKEL